MDVCDCTQVVLRHGQLHMCRNQEMVRSGKDGRGLFIVINGLVRIGYRDPLGNTQEYFLGTGLPPHAPTLSVTPPCSCLSRLLKTHRSPSLLMCETFAIGLPRHKCAMHSMSCMMRLPADIPVDGPCGALLGAGGISGLFHALTGEHLPGGRLEAVAEGNALGKGPVVFEVHQSAIEIIRQLAASAHSLQPLPLLSIALKGNGR